MTLPTFNLDNRVWADLVEEGRTLLPRWADAWTDHNAHDPGITLIELLAYRTELEMYRLNRVAAAHRQAFLSLIGARHQPSGPRPAQTLLVYEPSPSAPVRDIQAGDYFVPRQTAQRRVRTSPQFETENDSDRPRVPEFGFRAKHDLTLTGVRIASIQSFDGRHFSDITASLSRGERSFVWGRDPRANDQADLQPALYLGFDRKLAQARNADLTLWLLPPGKPSWATTAQSNHLEESSLPAEPTAPADVAAKVASADNSALPHHGMRVQWEHQGDFGWQGMDVEDDTRCLTHAGRIVIPGRALKLMRASKERTVGAVPSPHFYIRCRLAHGRPDAAPSLCGLFADAVLVEQWDETRTRLHPILRPEKEPIQLRRLHLEEEIAADIEDASADLVRRGWGPAAAGWGAWPATGPRNTPPSLPKEEPGREVAPFVVLGIGTGEPNQKVKLPTPLQRTNLAKPADDEPADPWPIRIMTDGLSVWTLEPPWAWNPRSGNAIGGPWTEVEWEKVPDLVLRSPKSAAYRLDEPSQSIIFGDGEMGRTPPPGAVIVARYRWTVAEAANFSAGAAWCAMERNSPEESTHYQRGPAERKVAAPIADLRFRNPLPAEGGQPAESLVGALSRLAAEFGAGDRSIALAQQAGTETLDGIDLTNLPPPPSAVTLLDFESLARATPSATVARARAWADVDPNIPGIRVPAAVTVVILPELPQDRPEPTSGLIGRVSAWLNARRSIACRVFVIGPQYLPVRVQVTVHVAPGAAKSVRAAAETAIRDFLHPLRGGPAKKGWPFGRTLHCGELLRVLGTTSGVRHVSGLRIAGAAGIFAESPVPVSALALPDLVELQLHALEDA